jgi:hypothetical protein
MGKKSKTKKTEDSNTNTQKSTQVGYDLFDNPMVRSAMAALSDEDKQKYKTIGDHLYGRINFDTGQSFEPPIAEAVAYIETSLQSGMHPSMLEENDHALLKEQYGEEWYKQWGYVKEDLTEMVTLNPILKDFKYGQN